MDSLADILVDNKIFIAFELYFIEMINELFKQLRCEAVTQYTDVLENNPWHYLTRWNLEGFLPCKYNRTFLKKKSLENTLRKF